MTTNEGVLVALDPVRGSEDGNGLATRFTASSRIVAAASSRFQFDLQVTHLHGNIWIRPILVRGGNEQEQLDQLKLVEIGTNGKVQITVDESELREGGDYDLALYTHDSAKNQTYSSRIMGAIKVESRVDPPEARASQRVRILGHRPLLGAGDVTEVSFGGTVATAVSSDPEALVIEATVPAGTGTVDVEIATLLANNGGRRIDERLEDAFTFVADAPPRIATITPASGPLAGGNVVEIVGTAFNGLIDVTFDGVSATLVPPLADARLTVQVPTGASTGIKQVVVRTAAGASNIGSYTYAVAPTIATISPAVGTTTGGNTVRIEGTGFDAGTPTVTFGGTPARVVLPTTATSVDVIVPAGSTGPAAVVVTTTAGSSAAANYLYTSDPLITAVTPSSGLTIGGFPVTLQGANFTGTSGVRFGTTTASIQSISDDQVVVIAPASTAGSTTITLNRGTGSATANFVYTSPGQPLVNPDGLSKTSARVSEQPRLVIQGANLDRVQVSFRHKGFTPHVTLEANNETNPSSAPSTQLELTVPNGLAPGQVDLVLVGPTGHITTLINRFTYTSDLQPTLPSLAGINPDRGPSDTVVELTGTDFSPMATVSFGDFRPATVVERQGTTLIRAVAPVSSEVVVGVVVSNGAGLISQPRQFTYEQSSSAPTLVALTPSEKVSGTGPASVTATGTNLTGGEILLGGVAVATTVASATELRFSIPDSPAGTTVSVRALTGGQQSNILTFNWRAAGGPQDIADFEATIVPVTTGAGAGVLNTLTFRVLPRAGLTGVELVTVTVLGKTATSQTPFVVAVATQVPGASIKTTVVSIPVATVTLDVNFSVSAGGATDSGSVTGVSAGLGGPRTTGLPDPR
ncbi:MAG: IPT/TIG domain-containing protein [bacterium]|nr:IPT/TIG domain-containing protein [bacterium]